MSFRHRTRRWLSSWLAAALLLMQFAVSAYACPGGLASAVSEEATAMAVEMADMPDCAAMNAESDKSQPLLCKAHCDQDKQSVNSVSPPELPSLGQIMSFVVARIDYSVLPAPLSRRDAADNTGPPRGSPPVYLTLQVLRN